MEDYKKTDLMSWESGKVEGFSGKNLIDLDNGGLKLVKVDPFATYPTHLHPNKTEYVYVLEGHPQIVIDETKYVGTVGDFFILPYAVEHSIANPSDEKCQLLVGAIAN